MAATASLNLVLQVTDNATKAIQNSAKDISSRFKDIGTSVERVGLGLSAFGAATGLALRGFVKEATQAQTEVARLTSLTRTATGASDAQIKALIDQADALERVGVVGAGAIMTAQGQIAAFGLHNESIEKLIPSLLDMAVAEGGLNVTSEQLKATANGLGKALQGQTDLLTKQGFQFDEATKSILLNGTEQERVNAIVKILDSTYKGMNETMAQTADGKIVNVTNQFAALSEKIGTLFLPILEQVLPKVTAFIEATSAWVDNNPKLASTLATIAVALAAFAAVMGPILLAIGPIVTGFQLLVAVIMAIFSPIGLLVAVIAALGFGIFMLIKHWDDVKNKMLEVWGAITNALAPLFERISGIVAYFRQLADDGDYLNDNLQFLPETIQKVVLAFHNIKQAIEDTAAAIGQFFGNLWTSISNGITSFAQGVGNALSALWATITSIFEGGFYFVIGLLEMFTQHFLGVGINDLIKGAVEGFTELWGFITDLWQSLWDGLTWVFEAWKTFYIDGMLIPFIEGVKAIWTGLAEAVKFVWNALLGFARTIWGSITGEVTSRVETTRSNVTGALDAIKAIWEKTWGMLSGIFSAIYEGSIKPVIQGAVDWITAMWEKVRSIISAIGDGIKGIGKAIGGGVSAVIETGKSVVSGKRAIGGSVTPGAGYMVGENGPEYFSPSTNGRITPMKGGGGTQVNITVTGNNISDQMDLDQIALRIGDTIMRNLKLARSV